MYCPHMGRVQAYKTWRSAFDYGYACATLHPKVMCFQ